MEQVNIGGAWKDIRGIWVNVGGTWRSTLGVSGNIGGTWRRSTPVYLYNQGTENHPWVEGYSRGQGSAAKESGSLYLYAGGGATTDSARTYVLNTAIDLTSFNTLNIEWVQTGSGPSPNFVSTLAVSTVKSGSIGTYDLRFLQGGAFARRTDSLNISSLSGAYYIRTHASIAWNDAGSVVRVYRVWLT